MNIRERNEKIEKSILSKYASLASESLGRKIGEEECNIRTAYQRDRDRIIHSKAFRRLKHKTQVFMSPGGDHYRTRLTHTLEVSQISRTIAKAMLLNEDLTEAIALGHDLGHTPFGHAGESALNNLCPDGFKHYVQSGRIVEKLEKGGKGLNLTIEVVEGIVCHTEGNWSRTLEGKVVRVADRIAYLNHDIDDSIRAGVLSNNYIPKDITNILGENRSQRMGVLVNSLIDNTKDGQLNMADEINKAFKELHNFMYENVYCNEIAKAEEKKVPKFIEALYNYFKCNYKKLPLDIQKIAKDSSLDKAVCDYIAGMTDEFAIQTFKSIFIPTSWGV